MREMTRPEFNAYEKRVEAVLTSVEQTIDPSDRADFDEVAGAAREVVDIRREYLEFTERQVDAAAEPLRHDDRGERRDDANEQWDTAVARFGLQAVETANEVLIDVEHYRERLDRTEAGELPPFYTAGYRDGPERVLRRAAELAVNENNEYMKEVAKTDQTLQRAIELIELSRDERPSAHSEQRERHGSEPADGSVANKDGAAGGVTDVAEAEQIREPSGDTLTAGQDDHTDDRQDPLPPEQSQQRLDERVAERRSAAEVEIARSDPPQQHVPRLRQIEMEIEARHERDRDDRER